jgi:hypothetical protein
MILQTVTTSIQLTIIGSPLMDPAPSPEEVWAFCLAGMGPARAPA